MDRSGHAAYDLHLHTCWSYDARVQAESYFERARELGVRCIAITEHHVLDSLPEVLEAAERFPDVLAIPSAELTVHTSVGPIDLLCYGFPVELPAALRAVLDEYHEWQRAYGAAVCRGVQALGFAYTDQDRLRLLHSYRPARALDVQGHTHVRNGIQRRHFIECGFIEGEDDYVPFLRRGAKAVPPPLYPAVNDVVPVVKEVGALVAIAHPHGPFRAGNRRRMDALREECRLDGIECAHPAVPAEFTPVYRAYCEEHGLFSVAGSDCHTDDDVRTLFARHGGEEDWLDEFLDRLG